MLSFVVAFLFLVCLHSNFERRIFIMNDSNGDIIIYQTEDGLTKINVKIENETVWLSQQQMA